MKQFFALLLIVTFSAYNNLSAQVSDPTLMTINGKDIPLSEFEYIYNKNNSYNVIDKKSLQEYVDLFINFKLKVEEALTQGLDTTSAFKSEFDMYRKQLADQYMTNEKMTEQLTEQLIKEAYDRKKEEVEVMHILVRIPNTGTSSDTLAAYQRALEYCKRAEKEDFEKLSQEVSEDPSAAQNGGRIGWISAMRAPYSFECMAYNTPVGKVSAPVRTFMGYHIIKVLNKRPSPGEVKVAHILLMNNRQDPSKNSAVEARADSIYQQIMSGADFGELAEKLSQDNGSAKQKGELPWFGSGQMIAEFENTAFALENKGDISKPIESQFGWHIIKLIDKKTLPGIDEMRADLENQIKQSDRSHIVNDSFVQDLKKEYNYTVNKQALADYYILADEYQPGDSLFKDAIQKLNAPLATYADKTITQANFNDYLNKNSSSRGLRAEYVDQAYKKFIDEKLLDYERDQLGYKHKDYRNLLQEYHDGILLFEIMNREVWDKATKDDAGLTTYFEANKNKYEWDKPHYKGRIIHAKNKATLKAAKNIVKWADNDSIDKYLYQRLNDSTKYVKIEKGLWAEGENQIIDSEIFKKAKYTPTEEYPYFLLSGKKLKTLPEKYTDVRGLVTADYQDYLEKNWITSLRQKYPVVINEKVLETVKKN